MNWDQIEGDWEQFKEKVKERWEKMSDDELSVIEGKKDRFAGLSGKLQEKYGMDEEEAGKQLADFLNSSENDKNEDHDIGGESGERE